MKKADKNTFGKNVEIESLRMAISLNYCKKEGRLGRKYAFNIFFAAFVDDGCGIYPLQMIHLMGMNAAQKMLKHRLFAH